MVNRSPENPQECDDTFSTSDNGIIMVDSSSSDDEVDYVTDTSQYMPLAQTPDNIDTDDMESAAQTGVRDAPTTCNAHVPASTREETVDSETQPDNTVGVQSVWALPREEPNIILNSEKVDQVKAAMANFTLPSSSIPPWAATVPEEQWREQLLSRIQSLGLQKEDLSNENNLH